MPKLPNGERAVVEIEKLRDYSLNPLHSRGRHKARVFRAALGLTPDDADWLRDELLRVAREEEAGAPPSCAPRGSSITARTSRA